MDPPYGNNIYQCYDTASFNNGAGDEYLDYSTESGSYNMERRISSRSDESFYQQDLAAVATENPYLDYQGYPLTEATVSYPEHSNGTAEDVWYNEGYHESHVKQEPELWDDTTTLSDTLTMAQIFASSPEELSNAAWSIAQNAESLLSSGNFDHLGTQYIKSDVIEEKTRSTDERKAVQEVLEHYLFWFRDTAEGSGDPTALLLDEAACQMQSRLKGPRNEIKQICYYAILCSLHRLRGCDETTSPERQQASKKSSEKAPHICRVPGCNNKSFGRSADLDRHIKMLHSDNKKSYYCDYNLCPRSARGDNPFFRHDHFRDHLRDQHKEDLLRRSVKPDRAWWASRSPRATTKGWWRCSRCLQHRVMIADCGYTCPGCGHSCEIERQNYRESIAARKGN